MRKYGKYEKRPQSIFKRGPKTANTLLQTYMTSLLCMVLCAAMFMGTSYAWFTSEVTNQANEIHIGALDVGLYKMKDGNPVSLNSSESSEKLFDGNICWEPGYTAMETIQIKNEGNLSFRYDLTFVNNPINGAVEGEDLIKVAKYFTVYVHAGDFDPENGDAKPDSFADIKASAEAEDGTWRVVRMGKDPATLADILTKRFPVLSGNTEAKNEEDTYVIALHMLETAGSGDTEEDSSNLSKELMGQSISLNVKLTAYQRTHESDVFNKDYDLKAHVTKLGALDIYASSWLGDPTYKMTLDTVYQFQPVETKDELDESTFKNYIADFAIWSSDTIEEDSIILAGYYDAWCQANDSPNYEIEKIEDRWIYFSNGSETDCTDPSNPIELLGTLVHYKDLCEFGNDGIGFLCGVKNLNEKNTGTVITVELRLYERDENNEKSDHYIVAGRYEYTLEDPTGDLTQMPTITNP